MSKKTVIVCDGCGKTLEKTSEIYHLELRTDKFWDGVENDYNFILLDFCRDCAKDIKNSLKKIAEEVGS